MHLTFADVARVTSEEFQTSRWPQIEEASCPATLCSEYFNAASKLISRVAPQWLGAPVAVVSNRTSDHFFARLLACWGVHVTLFSVKRPSPREISKLQWVLDLLRVPLVQNYQHLDHAPLEYSEENIMAAPRFQHLEWDPGTFEEHFAACYYQVDSLGLTQDRLRSCASIVRVGGTIELHGEDLTKILPCVNEFLSKSALNGWGVQSARHQNETWRLSFLKLSSPSYEFPREFEDHPQLLAHVNARLQFAGRWVKECRVLEAGCGTGIGSRLFRQLGAKEVVGLDYSPEAVSRAKVLTRDSAISFQEWNLNTTPLPFETESFDTIVCLEVLEHIYNQRSLLSEFHRLLRPGGRLIVSIPNKEYEEQWVEHNRCRNLYHVKVPSREDLLAWLNQYQSVQLARQLDLVGSTVFDENDPAPEGAFGIQNATKLSRETYTVLLAVASKSGQLDLSEDQVKIPHLTLYDNFSGQQLDWRRWYSQQEQQIAHITWESWCNKNVAAKANPMVCDTVRKQVGELRKEWFASWVRLGVGAYLPTSLDDVQTWMALLSRDISQVLLEPESEPKFQFPYWIVQQEGATIFIGPGSLPKPAEAIVYPKSMENVAIRELWNAYRNGTRIAWFREPGKWVRISLAPLLCIRAIQGFISRVPWGLHAFQMCNTQERMKWLRWWSGRRKWGQSIVQEIQDCQLTGLTLWKLKIKEDQADRIPDLPSTRPLRIAHYIGALYPGGAERQLAYVASGQKQAENQVRVLTTYDHQAERGHYAELLQSAGVETHCVRALTIDKDSYSGWHLHMLESLPSELQDATHQLVSELVRNPVDVLHCWLDMPNLIGMAAGLMARVPRIVLSTRNSNPTNFPRLLRPYMLSWYRLAAESGRVQFIANSTSGAESYADWIGIPVEHFHIIPNGFDCTQFPVATQANRVAARRSLGLGPTVPVMAGVFRLATEKQPMLFARVAQEVQKAIPELQVLLAGTGDLEPQLRQFIRKNKMEEWFHLLGRRQDVATIFLASDVSLLTSTLEGCPNAALESQYLGVPIVATDGGGTSDAIHDGVTGYLCGRSDRFELTRRVLKILQDKNLRVSMAEAGRQFITTRFGLKEMVAATTSVYRSPTRVSVPDTVATRAA